MLASKAANHDFRRRPRRSKRYPRRLRARGQAGECFILSGHYVSIPELFQSSRTSPAKKPIKTSPPASGSPSLHRSTSEIYYLSKSTPPLYTRYFTLHSRDSNANFSHAKATRELDLPSPPYQRKPSPDNSSTASAETGKIPPITAHTDTHYAVTSVVNSNPPSNARQPRKSLHQNIRRPRKNLPKRPPDPSTSKCPANH